MAVAPVALEMRARASALYLLPPAFSCVSPASRHLCVALVRPVAAPVELAAAAAGSNRCTAMQGPEDRETRNTELIAGNISSLARSVRDVRATSNMYQDTCRVEDRMDKSMFRGDEGGSGRSSPSNVGSYASRKARLVYHGQLLFPHR